MKIDEYLNSQKVLGLAKATRDSYTYALKDLGAFCKKEKIVNIEDVEEKMPALAKYFKNRRLTDQSIQQKFTNIKIFLKWAGKPSEYSFSISNKGRKAFKLKHARRWLSKGEVVQCRAYQFADSANSLRDRVIVALLIETGCRAKALCFSLTQRRSRGRRSFLLRLPGCFLSLNLN